MMEQWTAESLTKRRTLMRHFKVNLPDLLPRADWPRAPSLATEPTASDLLFENLVLLSSWPPPGTTGSPPEFPLLLLGDARPPEENRAQQFVNALLWAIEGAVDGAHSDLLDGFPDVGIRGFRTFRQELKDRDLSSLARYQVCLAGRYAIRHLDSAVFTLEAIRSQKRLHSGTAPRKRAGFDRLRRTGLHPIG